MISWFASLLPGELFYSACARYKQQFDYRDVDVNRELFSKEAVRTRFLSPFELPALKENVQEDWLPSHETIIRKHSTVPFALILLGEKRSVGELLLGVGIGGIEATLSAMERKRCAQGYAFCADCIKEDYESYGTSYWHREHNVQGVYVCAKHKVFLEFTSISLYGRNLSYQLPPSHEEVATGVRRIEPDNPEHMLFLSLAEDIALLLDYEHLQSYRSQVSQAIRTGLRMNQLDYNSNASVGASEALLNRTFSEELRLLLDFPLARKSSRLSWCSRVSDNCQNVSVTATLLALYIFGLRPRAKSEAPNGNRLQFFDPEKFVLEGGVLEGGVLEGQRCPISRILEKEPLVPLGVPSEVREELYYQVHLHDYKGDRNRRLTELGAFPAYYRSIFVPRVIAALSLLSKSQHRVTIHRLAASLGVSSGRMKTLLGHDSDLNSAVETALESKLDFAKRKIAMRTEKLFAQGVPMTPMMLMRETNTHVHYSELKGYIEECIEKAMSKRSCDQGT